jgi:hypothetical protein
MSTNFTGATLVSASNSLAAPQDAVAARTGLLVALEASLLGSQVALVRLDLEGIHRGTREQVDLAAKLAATLPCSAVGPSSVLAQQLRECEVRTLQAARVQAALLSRLRSKLRVMANMLAGPSVTYGPLAVMGCQPAPAWTGIEKG